MFCGIRPLHMGRQHLGQDFGASDICFIEHIDLLLEPR